MDGDRLDEVFSVLADERRRQVLHYFLDASEDVTSVEALATHVTATDDVDDRERATAVLQHVVLPKLDDAGVVEYDVRSGTVHYREDPLVTRYLLESRSIGTSPTSTQVTGHSPADILLVEDNPGDIRLIQEVFRDGGMCHDLHVVTDGAAALDFCYQRGDHAETPRPDIILLDFDLPQMDGDEVLDDLVDSDLRHVPVIVLSGSNAKREIVASYELGANAYLTKPATPDEFVGLVRSIDEFWLSAAQLPSPQLM